MSTPNKDVQLNIRVSPDLKARLDVFAELTGRSLSFVTTAALDDFLSWRIPQLDDLKRRLAEAEDAQFASRRQVEAVMKKWGYVRGPLARVRPSKPR